MTFDPADPISSVFAEMMGKPCWQVRKGHGSFLTFEFGEPHLKVREAIPEAASELLRRRAIWVHGDWHLWIYCCNWRMWEAGVEIAHAETLDAKIDAAARRFDGQKLQSVRVEPDAGKSRFSFERNLILETTPYEDPTAENWMLETPENRWLSYRADGLYSWHSGNMAPDQLTWSPLLSTR